MSAPINFVRVYPCYGNLAADRSHDLYDVIYRSGRVVTMGVEDMPKTVHDFCKSAKLVYQQYNRTYCRVETIFE